MCHLKAFRLSMFTDKIDCSKYYAINEFFINFALKKTIINTDKGVGDDFDIALTLRLRSYLRFLLLGSLMTC